MMTSMVKFPRIPTLTPPGQLGAPQYPLPVAPKKASPGVKLPVLPDAKPFEVGRAARVDIGRPHVPQVGRPVFPGIGQPVSPPAYDAPVQTIIGLRASLK